MKTFQDHKLIHFNTVLDSITLYYIIKTEVQAEMEASGIRLLDDDEEGDSSGSSSSSSSGSSRAYESSSSSSSPEKDFSEKKEDESQRDNVYIPEFSSDKSFNTDKKNEKRVNAVKKNSAKKIKLNQRNFLMKEELK